MVEVRRLDMAMVRGWKDDELDFARITSDVCGQPGVDQQAQRLDRRIDCAARAPDRTRAALRWQHVYALGSEVDSVRNRTVVDHAAVDEVPGAEPHRREHTRD